MCGAWATKPELHDHFKQLLNKISPISNKLYLRMMVEISAHIQQDEISHLKYDKVLYKATIFSALFQEK